MLQNRPLLHRAVAAGDIGEVRRLLADGVSVHRYDDFGYRALHIAAQTGEVAILQLLVGAGADVNACTFPTVDYPYYATPLQVARDARQDAAEQALLQSGADPNVEQLRVHWWLWLRQNAGLCGCVVVGIVGVVIVVVSLLLSK